MTNGNITQRETQTMKRYPAKVGYSVFTFTNNEHINDPTQRLYHRGACGVMVIVVGNGHDDTSSNPEWEWLHFT